MHSEETTAPETIRVVRGHATDEEIAALVAALLTARPAVPPQDGAAPRRIPTWRRPDRIGGHRPALSWRAEALLPQAIAA
jgi:hypothetical protein